MMAQSGGSFKGRTLVLDEVRDYTFTQQQILYTGFSIRGPFRPQDQARGSMPIGNRIRLRMTGGAKGWFRQPNGNIFGVSMTNMSIDGDASSYLVEGNASGVLWTSVFRDISVQNALGALGKEIATLSSGWMSFSNELIKSGNELTNIGNKASGVGKALTLGLTTPIVTGVGYITKLAVEYESAFAGVKKTVDETNTTSYEKLSKDFREMSKTLPATASDIARVAEVAGQLGIEADNITGFTKVMIDLGESTNLSATSAAESLAKFANITKLAPENYSRLGASIVDLGKSYCPVVKKLAA
jgi:hypothetical protein